MTWLYASLGLTVFAVVAGVVWLIVKGVRSGIQAEPLIAEAKKETDEAKAALEAHQRPDVSPAVLGRVLRELDEEAGG